MQGTDSLASVQITRSFPAMKQNFRTAEELTDAAFAAGVYQDPRDTYRQRLRHLKENDPQAFETARAWYEETLVPAVNGGSDPVRAWIEYGRQLAELTAPGPSFAIDLTGRAHPLSADPDGELLLHLPTDQAAPALPLAVPHQLSPAQRAALDLLVDRARSLT